MKYICDIVPSLGASLDEHTPGIGGERLRLFRCHLVIFGRQITFVTHDTHDDATALAGGVTSYGGNPVFGKILVRTL